MDASPPSSPRKLQPVIRLKQLRQEDSGFRVRISFDEIGAYLINLFHLCTNMISFRKRHTVCQCRAWKLRVLSSSSSNGWRRFVFYHVNFCNCAQVILILVADVMPCVAFGDEATKLQQMLQQDKV